MPFEKFIWLLQTRKFVKWDHVIDSINCKITLTKWDAGVASLFILVWIRNWDSKFEISYIPYFYLASQ